MLRSSQQVMFTILTADPILSWLAEKMRASRQTGNGSSGAPILTDLDNAVLDLIGNRRS